MRTAAAVGEEFHGGEERVRKPVGRHPSASIEGQPAGVGVRTLAADAAEDGEDEQ